MQQQPLPLLLFPSLPSRCEWSCKNLRKRRTDRRDQERKEGSVKESGCGGDNDRMVHRHFEDDLGFVLEGAHKLRDVSSET